MLFASGQKRIYHCMILGCFMISCEHEVLSARRNGSDFIFDQIIHIGRTTPLCSPKKRPNTPQVYHLSYSSSFELTAPRIVCEVTHQFPLLHRSAICPVSHHVVVKLMYNHATRRLYRIFPDGTILPCCVRPAHMQ